MPSPKSQSTSNTLLSAGGTNDSALKLSGCPFSSCRAGPASAVGVGVGFVSDVASCASTFTGAQASRQRSNSVRLHLGIWHRHLMIGQAQGSGQSVGSIIGARRSGEVKAAHHDCLDLVLIGAAVSYQAGLNLKRRERKRGYVGFSQDVEQGAAGLGSGYGGFSVGAKEDLFDNRLVWLCFRQETF